ncbi:lysophospholipid acyltransferase family protein [Gymnodinialimonas hymeniacidonis]|uniref:lysophospholipid acyltransferase family protein n=1 Tax=Gymnodinialimonas hymeniacidonis TaxID=3126508 RepID=UPI0034C6B807
MNGTWYGQEPPTPRRIGALDWLRILWRGGPLIILLLICFPLLLILRLPERAIWGLKRPITPYITQFVCIWACRFLSLRREVIGQPMREAGAYVSNHVSFLDIFVLNACKRLYFVAKAEVSGWPGVGWLALGTGTVFIRRDRREAAAQTKLFEDRLIAGHQLLFFPEGTSTDGHQVLPFKTTLFAAFFSDRLQGEISVQPVSLRYHAPKGANPRHYGWWGDMDFGPSLLQILATPGRGRVEVVYHAPLPVTASSNRKALAKAAEEAVRHGLETGTSLT